MVQMLGSLGLKEEYAAKCIPWEKKKKKISGVDELKADDLLCAPRGT